MDLSTVANYAGGGVTFNGTALTYQGGGCAFCLTVACNDVSSRSGNQSRRLRAVRKADAGTQGQCNGTAVVTYAGGYG
jgi:hypothetical protein